MNSATPSQACWTAWKQSSADGHLAADHYWTLDPRTAFDPSADQSSGLTVAQLSDDVLEVRELLVRSDEPVIWHDLAHIVGVLSRIAALDLP
jgi:hypothetical protein